MSEIKDYFDSITTSKSTEDIAKKVMERTEKRPERSRPKFKPFAVAAAATVALVGGVTAAAATGLIDFNEIFGGRITAQDEQLAGALVGAAQDFTWSVSDDDYMIELKGITGSKSDMLLVYEIARVDGKPVADFMTNIPEDGRLEGFIDIAFSDESAFSSAMDSNQYIVNDKGNIEVYNRIITDGNISGQCYSIDGVNLYPEQTLQAFLQQQDEAIFMWDHKSSEHPIGFYSYNSFNDNEPLNIALDDERIIGLELSWSVDFTYSPSETAILSKSISDENTTVSINRWARFTRETETLECKIIKSHFSCVGGWLEVEYYGDRTGTEYEKNNNVYLLTQNGSELPCAFVEHGHGTSYVSEPVTTIHIEIRYSETLDDPITAIDISEITAVSINGEIFPLA